MVKLQQRTKSTGTVQHTITIPGIVVAQAMVKKGDNFIVTTPKKGIIMLEKVRDDGENK